MALVGFKSTPLPLPTVEYSKPQQDQLIRSLQLYFNRLDSLAPRTADSYKADQFIGGEITITGPISSPTYIQMGNGSAVTPAVGRLWFDELVGSLNYGMGGGVINQQIGEELYRYGKASAAITESPLQLIYKTGVVSGSGAITFAPALAGITDCNRIIGVATEDIANNAFGRITTYGVVNNINTTGASVGETWVDGEDLYYNPATGGLTNIVPTAPGLKLLIGTVITASAGGSGNFLVRLGTCVDLARLADVQLASPVDGDLLIFDSALGYWRDNTLTAGANISVTNGAGSITIAATGLTSGTVTSINVAGGTTGLTFSGGPVTTSGTITMAGTLAIANGGTGAITAPLALTALGAYAASNPSGYTTNTGTVTSVGGTAPVVSSGGTAPSISMAAATGAVNGYLTAANWNTFNNKGSGSVTSVGGTGTVSGLTLSGSVTTTGNLTLGGTLSLTSGNVTTALGFTPYNATNPSGYITASSLSAYLPLTGGTLTGGLNVTSGNVGIGTATPSGRLSIATTTATGASIASWNSAYFVVGPNSGNTTGAALGMGYNTITDVAEISTIAPGVAWKPLSINTAGINFNSSIGGLGASLNLSGVLTAVGDVRAPIFYDSNDTGFYLDPNGGSRMARITLDSGDVIGGAATFNNMNQPHGTNTDFNTVSNFGFRYFYGSTNGPAIPSATQYYGMTVGLGSEYGVGSYASQFYWPRTPLGGLPYPSIRDREGGVWGAWSKIYAGWADAPSGSTFAATGDFRAPIFYDSANTAFYLDPASTGTSLNVAGAITAAGSVTTPVVTNAGTLALTATGANVVAVSTNGSERMRITDAGNVLIGTTTTAAGASGTLHMANAATVPTGNLTGGGVLFIEGGALKYRGSAGTVTTVAAA